MAKKHQRWSGTERRRSYLDFEELRKGQNDLLLEMKSLSERFKALHDSSLEFQGGIKESFQKVTLTLYGNGQPGLTGLAKNNNEQLKAHAAHDTWAFALIIGLLVTTLGWVVFHH